MKKSLYFLMAIACLALQDIHAQNNKVIVGDDSTRHLTIDHQSIRVEAPHNTPALLLQPNAGNVGIGLSGPTHRLGVSGDLRIGGANINSIGLTEFIKIRAKATNWSLGVENFGLGGGFFISEIDEPDGTFFINNAGNIGIGTTTPRSRINIDNGVEADHVGDGYLMIGQESTTNLIMDENEILVRNNGDDANLLLQQESGNVGIGIDNPIQKLEVGGDVIIGGGSSADGATEFMIIEGTTKNWALGVENNDGKDFFIGELTNPDGSFHIETGGNIGIGTTLPQSKMHILGSMDVSLTDNGYMQLGQSNNWNLAFDNNEILARDNGSYSGLYLQADGGDLMLCGQENGQVGIGITSPSFLPVDETYLLAVDGNIVCEELRVAESENWVWPDYVFQDSYNLMSLNQLEKFIKINQHLPNIPPGEIIDAEGFKVGEIQVLMMEKIEELTLYIIQQQKEIENLKNQIKH